MYPSSWKHLSINKSIKEKSSKYRFSSSNGDYIKDIICVCFWKTYSFSFSEDIELEVSFFFYVWYVVSKRAENTLLGKFK